MSVLQAFEASGVVQLSRSRDAGVCRTDTSLVQYALVAMRGHGPSAGNAPMISITLLTLSPDTLQRMAAHDSATETRGLRRERIGALVVAALVTGLAIAAVLASL